MDGPLGPKQAHAAQHWLHHRQCFYFPYQGDKRVVFLEILAVARIVILDDVKEESV